MKKKEVSKSMTSKQPKVAVKKIAAKKKAPSKAVKVPKLTRNRLAM